MTIKLQYFNVYGAKHARFFIEISLVIPCIVEQDHPAPALKQQVLPAPSQLEPSSDLRCQVAARR